MSLSTQRPNIIVLILDAVRAKNLSAYGGLPGTTKYLDAFAADHILFKRAFSPATWTIPSHASILTGLYLSQHRIESIKADRYFNDAIVTLPAALQSHGYRTAAFSQNFLFSPKYQLGGFSEFYDMDEVRNSHPVLGGIQRSAKDVDPFQQSVVTRYLRKFTGLRLFFNSLFDWVSASDEQAPFFVMANTTNAHYPWAPPPAMLLRAIGFKANLLRNRELFAPQPFQFNSGRSKVTKAHRQFWLAVYNAALTHVDQEVGRFLKRLRRWKGWQNTIVVVTADHGEMLGDYDDIFGHMLSLHDNLLHVPLIVRHPAYSGGIVVEGVVQNLDLYTSVIEWAACPTENIPTAQLQRPNLSNAIESPADSNGVAFAEEDYSDSYNPIPGLMRVNPKMDPRKYPHQQASVRTATHKYIWSDDGPGKLYNLVSDPMESTNLIENGVIAEQAVLSELQQTLETWRSELEYFPPNTVSKTLNIDPVTVERLRNLGYLE